MALDESRQTNLRNWESRVPIHVASQTYDVDGLASGRRQLSDVVEFDAPHLGDISGLDVVHLQCHIGTDTVSLARLGARVTGLDFSPSALDAGRVLAMRAGLDVKFVESELYGAVDALGANSFDLVYTGVGAIGWLPNIRGWAHVVAALLRPKGRLYLREGHPVLWALDDNASDSLVVKYPYFETAAPIVVENTQTYTDGPEVASPTTHEWNHGLAEIIQALLEVGMTITRFVEHDFCEWQALPSMVQDDDGRYRLPAALRDRVPLMYTLEARL